MADVQMTDNTAEVKSAMDQATARALEIIGGKIESNAKALVAPLGPKGNPMRSDITAQIRNSLAHYVDGDTVVVGSNLDFAAYVELGTGNKYEPSADWIESNVQKGPNSGLARWFYYDEKDQKVKIGLPISPKPFLRPAVENNTDEYKRVLENELKHA